MSVISLQIHLPLVQIARTTLEKAIHTVILEYLPSSLSRYRTRATINRSWFETALNYKPRILDPKIEEFPGLVYKLSVNLNNRSTI